jgi:hypothetical protein
MQSFEALIFSQCSGERPTCSKCLTRGAICRYVESEARQAKRKYEDLRKRQTAHEEVFSLIKTLPEQDAVGLFRRIRDGGDVGTILRHVRDGDLLVQLHLVPETRHRYELPYSRDIPASLLTSRSPYLDSLLYNAISQHGSLEYQSEYVTPYHAAVFVEPRLEKVMPSEWTTVCKDDTLMLGLLAAYFAHEYCLFPIFQKDYFLEDMAEPRTQQTPCCSPLLVNAMLAYACVSTNPYRFATSLISTRSTVPRRYRIVSGIGNQKVLAIDSLLRQRGYGRCRLWIADTAILRQFKRHGL